MKRRIDAFSIQGTKESKEEPSYCYYCGSKYIVGIEVIGTIDEPLIWECQSCNENMLRFSKAKTEKLLNDAPQVEITEKDWEEAWLNGPN